MPLRNVPIRRKLMTILLVTSCATLLLACAAYSVGEYVISRQAAEQNLSTLGRVIAANSTAALAFEDDAAAREILAALKEEPRVVAAALFDKSGKLLAQYPTNAAAGLIPATPGLPGFRFEQGLLSGCVQVSEGGKNLGTLCLRSSMGVLYERLRLNWTITAFVMVGSILLAYFLSSALQQQVSRPILALAEAAKAVTTRKDYSVRAVKYSSDELGLLTDSFNQMLAHIQEQTDKVQTQLARLGLLSRTTRAIGERQDLPSIFQVMVRSLEDHLPIDFGCVCTYDGVQETLRVVSVGAKGHELAPALGLAMNTTMPIDENGLAKCIRGQLVYEPDISSTEFALLQRLARGGLRALVFAPLLVESQVFGVLIAARREPGSFGSIDCEFLRQLSEHAALAAHQAQLYDALQRAYNDLRQTQQAVMQQERLRALGQMASGIAHDINNAISPASLYTESLLEREPNLTARGREYLQTISRAIDDVAATVARMREFYRQREPQLSLLPVNLNELVQQVLDLTRARWSDMPQQRGAVIESTTALQPDLPAVLGVESEIREALTNLIFNAVDAMPEGGTLTVRTKLVAGVGAIAGEAASPQVHLEVSDTGVGMDEDTRRRCLEPFFTTKGERGTGLGLAMVYGVMQRHSADIEIDSAPNQGTTFRLIFAVPATPAVPGETSVALPVIPTRMRILVVDDDPMLLKSLRDALEADGHIVVTANHGQVGIETFREACGGAEPFGVVLTDLGMPHVDGRRVAQAVKALSPNTPVIMLTGWGRRLKADGEIPPHVDIVLNKPPKLVELRGALARCATGGG